MGEGMKRGVSMLKSILVIGLVLVVGTLAYCQDILFPFTWHQKMTLEVEADGQVYTGSSVVRVSVRENNTMTKRLGYPYKFGAMGEAAFVEIPGQRYLFALLSGGPADSEPQTNAINIFKDQLPRDGAERFAIVAKSRLKKDIPPSLYPLLVTFADINDPTSVKEVNPNDLAATFGPAAKLKRITLEITDEPVTEGTIESVLGWYWEYRENGFRLNGKKCVACPVSSEDFADLIGTGDFKIGGKQ